ncbi:hypothetical protein C8K61_10148 [Pseudomonas sp. GV071]|nr:hypothetical protein C8K61_10148 [Pseudomonas sp. GV071]
MRADLDQVAIMFVGKSYLMLLGGDRLMRGPPYKRGCVCDNAPRYSPLISTWPCFTQPLNSVPFLLV